MVELEMACNKNSAQIPTRKH